MSQTDNSVIPFAPTDKGNDQLDKAGNSILNLLHKAAGVAEKNSQHALDIAQQLSNQLGAAEHRIADLEAEAETHRDRADRGAVAPQGVFGDRRTLPPARENDGTVTHCRHFKMSRRAHPSSSTFLKRTILIA